MDPRPKGLRLLVALCLVVSIVVIGFGLFLIVIASLAGGGAAATDLGVIFVILGMATFVPRYGYSNGKSWGRKAGFSAGAAYALLGLLLLAVPDLVLSVLGVTSLAFGLANLYYLLKPATRAYFARRPPEPL